MPSKPLMYLLFFIALIALIVEVNLSLQETPAVSLLAKGVALTRLLLIGVVIRAGTSIRQPVFRLVFAVIIVSILSKLMHWPYKIQLALITVLVTVGIYTFLFIRKKSKKPLDIVKWVLVLTYASAYLEQNMHIIPFPADMYLETLVSVLFWLVVFWWLISRILQPQRVGQG